MPFHGITVVIEYRTRPGEAVRARSELAALIATVVAEEPACRGITLYQDPGDATRLLLYERWADKATYEGPHMRTPHLQAFIAKAADFFAGPPDISFWELVADVQAR